MRLDFELELVELLDSAVYVEAFEDMATSEQRPL
jgi:hypothetical protein